MKWMAMMSGFALALTLGAQGLKAQEATNNTQAKVEARHKDDRPLKTFYLTSATQPADGNEILTGLRLMLEPDVRLWLVPSQNVILMRASEDQLALAERLISELDKPKKTYRVTYTVTESEAGKRVGVMHFAMLALSGQRATMKQGSRVPIATGSYEQLKNGEQVQFSYLDIGMNFDGTVSEVGNGVVLKSKVEQSSIAEGESKVGPQDPIVRQGVIEDTSATPLGRPLVLGSLDIQGSTRHLDVEVVVDEVK